MLLLALVGWPNPITVVLVYLGVINLTLLAFNLLPAFPLDGGRVFRAALWGLTGSLLRATRIASVVGQGFGWVLMGFGAVQLLGGNPLQGVWLVLIGLFLSGAARASYQDVLVRQMLAGEPLTRFVTTEPAVVSPEMTLQRLVEDHVYRFRHQVFPVCTDGRLVGVIFTRALARYPRDQWGRLTVAEAMEADPSALCIPPGGDALQALRKMHETDFGRLLVVDSGRLVGLVAIEDLFRFLELKSELEGDSERTADAAAVQSEEVNRIHRPRSLPAGRGEEASATGRRAVVEE
jgi:CBS domain-containing protein